MTHAISSWAWLPWIAVVPACLVLGWIDFRTRLLPNRIMFPTYAAVLVLLGVGAALDSSPRILVAAAIGWALLGGLYFVTWFIYPKGMGYGDVRLAGVLGLALGALGLAPVVVGGWLGMFIGAIGSLALRTRTGLRANAHGPGMILGAFIGALWGTGIAHALGY